MRRKFRSNVDDRASDLVRYLQDHIGVGPNGELFIDDMGREAVRQCLHREGNLGVLRQRQTAQKRSAVA